MKKLVQNLKNGEIDLLEIPKPNVDENQVLIKSTHSLISLGTERMLVDFAKSNYLNKALKQPEKVKMVLDKMKSDGIGSTINSVFNKLNDPIINDIRKNKLNIYSKANQLKLRTWYILI